MVHQGLVPCTMLGYTNTITRQTILCCASILKICAIPQLGVSLRHQTLYLSGFDVEFPHRLPEFHGHLSRQHVCYQRVQLRQVVSELIGNVWLANLRSHRATLQTRTLSSSKLQQPCKISTTTGVHAITLRGCVSGSMALKSFMMCVPNLHARS